MAFTTAAEIAFINQVMDRIGAAQITLADQTSVEALTSYRHWSTTLNSLIRSFEWPFLAQRDELSQIKEMTLDASPTSAWSVDDTITGISSGTTATILSVTSDSEYDISHVSGSFTDGETITNATVSKVYYNGVLVTYGSETVYTYSTSGTYQINCGSGYPSVSAKTPDFEWDYQYELPSDFMRLISVYEDDGDDLPNERWVREGNRILTNYNECNIRYIKSVTDPSDFDPLFSEVLLLRMAWKLIPVLAGSLSKTDREEIKNELQSVETKARTICSQENNQTGRMDLNLARYGS